jgi:hypothetical protein
VELKLGSALLKDGIKEGDDVYFECHLKSNPPIHKLSWMLNVIEMLYCVVELRPYEWAVRCTSATSQEYTRKVYLQACN